MKAKTNEPLGVPKKAPTGIVSFAEVGVLMGTLRWEKEYAVLTAAGETKVAAKLKQAAGKTHLDDPRGADKA